MARDYEIKPAFIQAMTRDGAGRMIVTTSAFRSELEKVNHHWSLDQCNAWIERIQTSFLDITEDDSSDRTYALRNMGRVM